jgi:hypothetical protein
MLHWVHIRGHEMLLKWVGMSENGWLSKWDTTCAFSMLSRYATHLGYLYDMFPSWHAVFLCHQTRTRPSTGRNKNLSFWPMDSFPITNIPRDQSHRATRWRQDSCGHLIGRLVHRRCLLRRLLTVLTDTWPPTSNSSRIRVDVAKKFLLAYRVISLSHYL